MLLFDFVKNVSPNLFNLANRIEDQLYEHPDATLIKARLYGEQIIKIVSEKEELEEVCPLKNAERIHKLYRQNAIEEDIYMKLEWIRKKGNKAAHKLDVASINDALQAHRFIFDISLWYMLVYVNYDFEKPIYKLPERKKVRASAIEPKDLDKVIKPYLNHTNDKIDSMWSEVRNELEKLKQEKERTSHEISTTSKPQYMQDEFPLLDYLKNQGLDYIDKRAKNGSLWVVGDWTINKKIFPLKKHEIYFRYTKKGGRSTQYKPAWFLLNKTLIDTSILNSDESLVPAFNTEESREMQDEISIPTIIIEKVSSHYWETKEQLLLPVHLSTEQLPLSGDLEGITLLRDEMNVKCYDDITEETLRGLYQSSLSHFYKAIADLYFLGFRFTGKLSAFQPAPSLKEDYQIIVTDENETSLLQVFQRYHTSKLKQRKINSIKNLNGRLVSSIAFVLNENIENVKHIIQKKEIPLETRGDRSKNKTNSTVEDEQPSVVIKYQERELTVAALMAAIPINGLGIQGCNHFLKELSRMNIKWVKDMPTKIDDLHIKMTEVGPGTVRKFWEQFVFINSTYESSTVEEDNDSDQKNLRLLDKTIIIPEQFVNLELKPIDYPGSTNAIKTMIKNGIKTYGKLPGQFNEIGQLKGIGKIRVQHIFERISIIIDSLVKEMELEQLSDGERLKYELNNYIEWYKRISNSQKKERGKIPARYLRLTKKRFLASLKGKHLTLQELGEQEGVTRERIRQILVMGDKWIAEKWIVIFNIIVKQMEEVKIVEMVSEIHLKKYFDGNQEALHLLLNALETVDIYNADIDGTHILTKLNSNEFKDYIESIQFEVEEHFELQIITNLAFREYCQHRSLEDQVPKSIIFSIASQAINWISEDQGVLISITKARAVEMIMLQYPNGAAVYKDEVELNEKANKLMPGRFEKERDFYAIFGRDDIADRMVLWGRGMYIHTTFITNDKEWVHDVQEIALTLLKQEAFIHVSKLYVKVKDEALKRNIPNEYALFSLIRRFDKGILSLERFPTIQLEGVERQENYKWVHQYVGEHSEPVSIEKMTEVFVDNRGWKRFTLEQILSKSNEVIQYRHGFYTLASRYNHIKKKDLDIITPPIETAMRKGKLISIRSVFTENEMYLRSIGIETRQILYAVLKTAGIPFGEFIRYPYIVSVNYEEGVLPGRVLVEDYILEQEDIVAREEVTQWIIELAGENDTVLDLALLHSSEILLFSRGQFGEYIHRQTINMYAKTEQLIQEIVTTRYEEIKKRKGRNYVLLRELYSPTLLPKLPKNIPWSQVLLGDILKKANQWTMIGSYDEILLPVEDSIANEVDFINYLLRHHFNGAVKMNTLQSLLAELRYSNNGRFLASVNERLESGSVPFKVEGDELIHQDLLGGVLHEG